MPLHVRTLKQNQVLTILDSIYDQYGTSESWQFHTICRKDGCWSLDCPDFCCLRKRPLPEKTLTKSLDNKANVHFEWANVPYNLLPAFGNMTWKVQNQSNCDQRLEQFENGPICLERRLDQGHYGTFQPLLRIHLQNTTCSYHNGFHSRRIMTDLVLHMGCTIFSMSLEALPQWNLAEKKPPAVG